MFHSCRCDERLRNKTTNSGHHTDTHVGVMKDYELKLRDLHDSHTLGCSGDWNTYRDVVKSREV